MKYWHLTTPFINRLCLLIIVGIALCTSSFSLFAADYTNDDSMMRKLFEFHSKLAKQGNLESITRLGVMYERGEGVGKDRKKAKELYQYAADKGYKPAKELLANISSNRPKAITQLNATDTIRVPMVRRGITPDNTVISRQKELENKLEQQQAAAEAAREELDKLRQTKQEEDEKQQKLLEEIQNVKKAQEQLALERAKAEATRREMEEIRKKQEEELRQQELQTQALQKQKAQAEKQLQQTRAKTKEQANKTNSDDSKFSSNPCNTPAARFMSTCN